MEKILLQIISGAAAGYITNDIAIQMLFKKYFGKFGGVIVRTRDSFEKNVSELVEDEVINHETLKKEIDSPEFRKELLNVVSDFYTVSLKEKCGEKTFAHIKNYDESKDAIVKTFKNESKALFDQIISSGTSSIYVNNLIDEKGKEIIATNIYGLAYEVLRDKEYIYEFYNKLVEEHSEKKLSDLLTLKGFNLFEAEILRNIDGLGERILRGYSGKLKNTCESIYETLDLDKIIEDFTRNIQDKSLLDILGKEKSFILIEEVKNDFVEFIKSQEGKKILNSISTMIIEILKEQKISLSDMLDTSMKSKIDKFFMEQLPSIITEIISWIRENKENFEIGIEESVDEVISQYGVVKETILKFIRNVFMEDIAKKYAIINKGIDYLEKYKDDKKLGEKLSEKVLQMFQEKSIGEIISDLEKNKIISSSGIQEFLKFNMEEIINRVPRESILNLFNIKISKMIPKTLDVSSLLGEKIKAEIIIIVKNNLESGKFEKQLKETVKNEIFILKEKKLCDLIGSNKTVEFLGNYSLEKINDNKLKLIENLKYQIDENFGNKKLNEILPCESFNGAREKFRDLVGTKLEEGLKDLKGTIISDLVDNISKSKDIDEKTVDIFLNIIDNKLEEMLKGNISKVVANNIHSLDNRDLNSMVKDFMGRELRAINIAGAGLGGLVGLGAGNLSGNLGVNVLLYSAIGVITNSLAIGMLFKPYKPFIGIQGVIPKNKPRFTKNMAKFVDEMLLNEKVAGEMFRDKKENILKLLKDEISENNFKLVEELFLKNSDSIFNLSYEIIKCKVQGNQDSICNKIGDSIGKIKIDTIFSKDVENKLSSLKIKIIQDMDEIFFNEMRIKFRSNKALGDIIPIKVKSHVDNMLENKIEKFIRTKGIENIENTKVLNFIYDNLNKKDEIFHRKLVEIIGKDTSLGKDIGNYMKQLLNDENFKKSIMDSIKMEFSKEFSKDKRMDQLFNGKLIEIVYNNKEKFIETFYNKIEDLFKNERENLINTTINGVTSELGLFQRGTYNIIGGDELIEKIVSNFLDNKVPYLIEDSKGMLSKVIEGIINEFASSSVEDFSIELNPSGVKDLVDNISTSNTGKEKIQEISKLIMSNFLDKTPEDYLKVINIKSLVDVFKLFLGDVIKVLESVKIVEEEKIKSVSNIISKLLGDFIEEDVYPLKINNLTTKFSDDDIREVMGKIYSNVFYSNTFENIGEEYTKDLGDKVENMDVSDFVDIPNFKDNIKNLLNNEEWYLKIKGKLDENCKLDFEKNILSIFNSIEYSTKEEICDITIDAFINSLADNFQGIIKSLNIAKVTEEEINLMSDAKLREVFLRIVGTYFRKLKIYGVNGFLFGINNLFSIFLVFIYLAQLLKSKKETEHKK